MKVKKTKRRKRKLLLTDEAENKKPEKMIRSEKSEGVESAVDFVLDTMPTRGTYREQLEIGIRNHLLVLLQVNFWSYPLLHTFLLLSTCTRFSFQFWGKEG